MSQIYLKYGEYAHKLCDAEVVISRQSVVNDVGITYAIDHTWQINGKLEGDTQAELTQAIRDLEYYYSIPDQNISLRFGIEDGNGNAIDDPAVSNPTAHYINATDTLHGVRVTQQPSYPIGRGAEYSTFRSYQITVEARVALANLVGGTEINRYTQWTESVTVLDGQPKWVPLEVLDGPPVIQKVSNHTIQRVIQEGTAIADILPPYPQKMYPTIPTEREMVRRSSPTITSTRGGGQSNTMYQIDWQFVYLIDAWYKNVYPSQRPGSAK